jgi:prolyl-tRNA synthetase
MSSKASLGPSRDTDFPNWYQSVIEGADLAEHSPTRGCMVIKPYGYAIWDKIKQQLDQNITEMGHENIYCPMLIPLAFFEQEAEHVDGFAKECAVVTHTRLKQEQGALKPDGELDQPYVIRPTSETMIGHLFAKWIQSHRDLPKCINQWANIVRWEMRPRLFLRTSEFLWQEGHTAHQSQLEAQQMAQQMIQVYSTFANEQLAMPVTLGEKTADERFPGAQVTYTIEAMMQDGKALQAGTSHDLGQNFAKAFNIQYQNADNQIAHVFTTSWGVSTRLIGGLIMTHSDDHGLVLPPNIAPYPVLIIPIHAHKQPEVLQACKALQACIQQQQPSLIVKIDQRHHLSGGQRVWQAIKKGVPIIIELGPKDIEKNQLVYRRRDQDASQKHFVDQAEFTGQLSAMLSDMQSGLYQRALKRQADLVNYFDKRSDFEQWMKEPSGFAMVYCNYNDQIKQQIQQFGLTARCEVTKSSLAPDRPVAGPCLWSQQTAPLLIIAKAY